MAYPPAPVVVPAHGAPLTPSAAATLAPPGWTVHDGFLAAPPAPRADWRMRDFELLHKLGGGQYGSVYLAAVRGSGFVVALKRLQVEQLAQSGIAGQLRREVEIAFHTRHPHLLRTYGFFVEQDSVYLIMEACARGMLYGQLARVKTFPPATAARFVAQLAEALLYLHQHHIMHRDIKPENILLDHNNNVKLADFGWSVHDPQNRRRTACGTPEYLPPEIVEHAAYDATADLWCLGIFCFELLVGHTPFAAEDQKEIYRNIRRLEFRVPDAVPPEARDLIESLLQRDAARRPPLHRVLRHPFLVAYYYGPAGLEPPTGKRARQE